MFFNKELLVVYMGLLLSLDDADFWRFLLNTFYVFGSLDQNLL